MRIGRVKHRGNHAGLSWIRRIVWIGAAMASIATTGLYIYARGSLPDYRGELTLDGLGGRVSIDRDSDGVPRILAASASDAYFALGFAHAQDRLFQMEMQRRIAAGRLSELLGGATLDLDRYMRTLGLYDITRRAMRGYPAEIVDAAESYAAGVNAFLRSHDGPLPPEFVLLGAQPAPWRPEDSIVWGRLMALQLSSNMSGEMLRARLLTVLSKEQVAQLWPPLPDVAPTTLSVIEAAAPAFAAIEATGALVSPLGSPALGARTFGENGASNAWAIAGDLTASGKPILAGDPHLALNAPILWYLARLEAPDLTVAGATVPGTPFTIIGHNGSVAWTFTTTGADVQDIVIEKIAPADPTRYLTPDGTEPFQAREEIIRVKDADPVVQIVRSTRHGPVISDARTDIEKTLERIGGTIPGATPEDHYAMALSWPNLRGDDRTPVAIYRLNRARTAAEAREALRDFHSPVQNVMFADTAGAIGFIAAGRIPIRKGGRTGAVPALGWREDADWKGFIPFDELPQVMNPSAGVIVNANNKVEGPDYPYPISNRYEYPYRAERIIEVIGGLKADGQKIGRAHSLALQIDNANRAALDLLPLLTHIEPQNAASHEALELLRAWDGVADRSRPEALIFAMWLKEIGSFFYSDELGKSLFEAYWHWRPRTVKATLTEQPEWCDVANTRDVETCDRRLAQALASAVEKLLDTFGGRPSSWEWGEMHFTRFAHPIFGRTPVIRRLTDLRVPMDGDFFTVNRAAPAFRDEEFPFASVHGAGLRVVFDLADLDASRFMIATGQSGNILSPLYDNMVEAWRDGEARTIAAAVGAHADRLVLNPR